MKKCFNVIVLMLLVMISNNFIIAGPFDTQMTTLTQPNDVTFTGRIWGDEFIYWAETEDGFRFVQASDGWYYFATLDGQGEFAPTNYKVGIDQPPAHSYQLERTQARMDEILLRMQEFSEGVEGASERFAEQQQEAPGGIVTWDVGIILIQFPDFPRFSNAIYRPNGYLKSDFEKMMFSENGEWYDPDPIGGTPHPEQELIYGSFRDYWYQISKEKLIITGEVVNPDENGVIEWLDAEDNRAVYIEFGPLDRLANEAIEKAVGRGWISLEPGHPKYYDKLVVVFAGTVMDIPNLFTFADPDGNYIQVAERSSKELWQNEDYSFTHMGVYAHEFGHNLGFNDEYLAVSPPLEWGSEDGMTDTYNFDLMSWGLYNGPLRKGECPATLSPYYRIIANWISSTPTADANNFVAEYDYENPKVYRINPISAIEEEHFLFESRGRDGFDKFIPWDPNEPTPQPGNLIVWYHNKKFVHPLTGVEFTDRSSIIPADNTRDWSNLLTDFFPSTFNPNSQDFNDISIPATTMGFLVPGSPVGNYRRAHFALNGIQKQADNTFIEEIILYHPLRIVNGNIGGWQAVSVPYGLNDYSLNDVFPTAISAFKFDGYYVQVYTLENGPGYWANFDSETQWLSFEGTLIEYLEIPVNLGWNLTGSIPYVIPRELVTSVPPGIITSIFRYDNPGGYILLAENDNISGGLGYWIQTTGSGNVILDRYAESSPLPKIGSFSDINLNEMDKFIITDSEGFSQSLYVSNIDIDTTLANINIDLPPMYPEIDFDSRFEYNEFIKRVSADSGMIDLDILVHTFSYPVSLTWEINPANGVEYSFIGDSTSGKISSILTESGKTTFNQLNNNRIKLFATVNKSAVNKLLPKEFVLEQNYPNPFNPNTVIKFAIPKEAQVNLSVFNILGEKVRELKNEILKPGFYEAEFNASMLASGVYMYRIQAGDFVETKKMVLMK